MGSRSSRLQKRLYPRSRTKMDIIKNTLTGKPNEFPSIKASGVLDVDPEQTPDYTALLRNVSGNIKSFDPVTRLKNTTPDPPRINEDGVVPAGYLDKHLLMELFSDDKTSPALHEKYNLSEDDLKLIFKCFGGYKIEKDKIDKTPKDMIQHSVHLDTVIDEGLQDETERLRSEQSVFTKKDDTSP